MRRALCSGVSCCGCILQTSLLIVISSVALSVTGLSATQLTDAVVSDSRQQSAASVEALREQEEQKRRNSFRSDFGKRLPSGVIDGDLLENLQESAQQRARGEGEEEEEEENGMEGLDKRLSRFRSDFGKRRYRADFGKRRFRADFGKRSDESGEYEEEEDEVTEDGRQNENMNEDKDDAAQEEKRARFRADLGKRAARIELLGRPGRRFYRADLGKRRYRSDFG